ncbi:MAG: hypothetical protein ACOX3T_04035 [Bdellovibrionota bacterium]
MYNFTLLAKPLGLESTLVDIIKENNFIDDLVMFGVRDLRCGLVSTRDDADKILSFIKEHKLGDVKEIAKKLQGALKYYLKNEAYVSNDKAKEIRSFAKKHGVDLEELRDIIEELGFPKKIIT